MVLNQKNSPSVHAVESEVAWGNALVVGTIVEGMRILLRNPSIPPTGAQLFGSLALFVKVIISRAPFYFVVRLSTQQMASPVAGSRTAGECIDLHSFLGPYIQDGKDQRPCSSTPLRWGSGRVLCRRPLLDVSFSSLYVERYSSRIVSKLVCYKSTYYAMSTPEFFH